MTGCLCDRTANPQREAVLDVLHEPRRPWMATGDIAARTPWSRRTVWDRLRELVDEGLVEMRAAGYGRGRDQEWRLA